MYKNLGPMFAGQAVNPAIQQFGIKAENECYSATLENQIERLYALAHRADKIANEAEQTAALFDGGPISAGNEHTPKQEPNGIVPRLSDAIRALEENVSSIEASLRRVNNSISSDTPSNHAG